MPSTTTIPSSSSAAAPYNENNNAKAEPSPRRRVMNGDVDEYEKSKQFTHPSLHADAIDEINNNNADDNDADSDDHDEPPVPPQRSHYAPNGIKNSASAGSGRMTEQRPSITSLGQDGGLQMTDIYEEGEEGNNYGDVDDNDDGEDGGGGDDIAEADDDYDDDADNVMNEDDVVRQLLPQPPDGGYGWIIVIMSFLLNMIVDGISYSFAILLTEWVDYFGDSKGKTAWVGSLLTGVYLLVGPITSALVNSFGCRSVSIAGSIIAGAGFALSALAPSTTFLMFSYGILGGFGLGLVYLPAMVLVCFYFVQKRAMATGIAVAGSGCGGFLFPPIISWLLSTYSWQSTMLIMAGITLQGCVVGSMMRPLESQVTIMDRQRRASQAAVAAASSSASATAAAAGASAGDGSIALSPRTSVSKAADAAVLEAANERRQRRTSSSGGAEDSDPMLNNTGIDIEITGDKVKYNPEKLKVSGLLKRMKIAREVTKKQRETQRQRCRYDSETIDTLETVSSELFNKYKVNVEPGVHSVHSLHNILTNVGFDFDKLPRRQPRGTPPTNPNNNLQIEQQQQYSLQIPRQRSHHSEMGTSIGMGMPSRGTPSVGSMPPINESDIYSGEPSHQQRQQPGQAAAAAGGAARGKYGRTTPKTDHTVGGGHAATSVGVRRHRNHVSYATTGLSDDIVETMPSADAADGNAAAPPIQHRRRRSQPGRPSIPSASNRPAIQMPPTMSNNVSRQPSIASSGGGGGGGAGTPKNSLQVPTTGMQPKLRSSPSRTSATGTTAMSTSRGSIAPNIARPMYRDDILFMGSVKNLPEFKQARNVSNYLASTTHIPDEEIKAAADAADKSDAVLAAASAGGSRRGSVAVVVAEASKNLCQRLVPPSARATLRNMLRLDLLKSRFFALYCFSNLMCMSAFYIPYVYLPDLAIVMSEDGSVDAGRAALILSVIGVANTLSRVVFGALVTLHWRNGNKVFDALWVNNVTLIVTGVLTLAFPIFGSSYNMLLLLGGIFGVTIAPFVSLTSIIIADRMGVSAVSNGFGLLCLFRGIAAMAGPPLAGMLYDATQSFKWPFFCAGLLIIASALVTTILAAAEICSVKSEQRKKNLNEDNQNNNRPGVEMGEVPSVEITTAASSPGQKRFTNVKKRLTNGSALRERDDEDYRNRKPNEKKLTILNTEPGVQDDDDVDDDADAADIAADEQEFNAAMQQQDFDDDEDIDEALYSNNRATQPLLNGGRQVPPPQIVVDSAHSLSSAKRLQAIADRQNSERRDSKQSGVTNSSVSSYSNNELDLQQPQPQQQQQNGETKKS